MKIRSKSMLHIEERKNKMHTYLFWKDVDGDYFYVRASCTTNKTPGSAWWHFCLLIKIFTQIGVIHLSVGGKE